MKKYQVGDLIEGIVSGFEKYGIFLTFEDNYVGLIHISELSDHFVKDVSLYAEIGDKIPCVVLDCDDENRKLKCSIKNTEYSILKDINIDHGFAPLKKQLPIWVDEKIKRIKDANKR